MPGNSSNYRPQVGESLFVSLVNEQPFLTTIKGFHYDDRFSEEQVKYVRRNGRENSTSLSNITFFPDAPIDTRFLYVAMLDQSEFMDRTDSSVLGYFFDPQSSFDYVDAIKSGEIKPPCGVSAEFVEYYVMVEKV